MNDPQGEWTILAAGGIIFRKDADGIKVLIVHRNRYNDYSLPKGKLDKKENFESAALREVFEETGYKTEITGISGAQSRYLGSKLKITVFFTMSIVDNTQYALNQNTDNEVKETIWINVNDLSSVLSYPEQTELILKTLNNKT